MHRVVQDHLEEVLAESTNSPTIAHLTAHLAECEECRSEVSALRQQASLLRALRPPETAPQVRPGFYARVMERIEAQRPISIWELFFDSAFGRRIAIASMALAFIFSIYLVSSERYAEPPVTIGVAASSNDDSGMTLSEAGLPDKDTVLVNLVTYREQ
jgi:predicted anti-sigma-YlaC factor YlaD